MVHAAKAMRVAGRWQTPEASLMEVLGRETDEVANCRVLAWALDPLSAHGVGPTLLAALASRLGVAIDPEGCRLATVQVEVSRHRNRSDIVVAVPSPAATTIVIEAKVSAAELTAQCTRIEEDWKDAVLVFLTRTGAAPRTSTSQERWHSMRWLWFIDALEVALQLSPETTPGGRSDRFRQEEARAALADWLGSARRNLT